MGPTTTTTTSSTTSTTIDPGATQDPQCPNRGQLELFAGVGRECTTNGDCPIGACDGTLGRCRTETDLSTGWTGLGHDTDVNDGVIAAANLLCPGPADPTCGNCLITGLSPVPGNCRCNNDPRIICDEPFVADADDCGGNTCDCYFGPPLPLSAATIAACVVNRFADDISGTANIDAGAGTVTANLRSVVYTGQDNFTPCPFCVGDTVAADGIRNGTCMFGVSAGLSCDTDAANDSFPAPGGEGHSLDCLPDGGKNVSGAGLRIGLRQTTGVQSLNSDLLCGFPDPPLFITQACQCGICSDDLSSSTACSTNAECATCTTNADCQPGNPPRVVSFGSLCDASGHCSCDRRANFDPSPNQCANASECIPSGNGDGKGICTDGPDDPFCDGIVRANGEGIIQCLTDFDCGVGAIGRDAGNCTLMKTRRCFQPTITSVGMADPNAPVGGTVFCIPPTGNGGINGAAGLPGPGRVLTQGISTLFCASNPSIEYTPGVGGCP